MRTLKRVLVALGVGSILFFGLIMLASESGEVVVLTTADSGGATHETRLWVVEYDGALWLRAGAPSSAWLERLRHAPKVKLTRAGVYNRYRALPSEDAGVREAIHSQIARKYGWAESLIRLTRDGSASVPVRLESLD